MTTERIVEISYDEAIPVEFDGEVRIENNGIGRYEFHGSTGIDRGTDYPVCTGEIAWNRSKYTEPENQIIEAYLNENMESIMEDIESEYEIMYC